MFSIVHDPAMWHSHHKHGLAEDDSPTPFCYGHMQPVGYTVARWVARGGAFVHGACTLCLCNRFDASSRPFNSMACHAGIGLKGTVTHPTPVSQRIGDLCGPLWCVHCGHMLCGKHIGRGGSTTRQAPLPTAAVHPCHLIHVCS